MSDVALHGGLPGRVTETALVLPRNLPITEWAASLQLLGRLGRGLNWWIADALLYGEENYGEMMSQYADATGLTVHTIQNLLWVGRAWPRSRRREELSFAHHAELAALDPSDQDHWIERAIAGGWSVTALRHELKGTVPDRTVACPACGARFVL